VSLPPLLLPLPLLLLACASECDIMLGVVRHQQQNISMQQ
jgi:hypothetical protein